MNSLKVKIIFLILLTYYPNICSSENRGENNEKKLTDFAIRSIYRDRLCYLDSEFRKLFIDKCKKNCNFGSVEFSLSMLGHGNFKHSANALINLIGTNLGTSLSESLPCEIFDRLKNYDRNKIVFEELKNMDPKKVRLKCLKNVSDQLLGLGNLKVNIDEICKSEKEILEEKEDYLNAISQNGICAEYEK